MTVNAQVTDYIQGAPEGQRQIMETIRALVARHVPGATENIKWGRPVFTAKKDFAYLKTAKAYVTLGFFDAGKIHDPEQRLEGTGKTMRHLKLKTAADIDPERLGQWFRILAQ